jgi:glycosyl transferase family 25
MEYIDKVIYINLDHRTDRRSEFEAECKRVGIPNEKIVRFPAIKTDPSIAGVGCSRSHAAALQLAHEQGLKNVLICEDDCNFHVDPAIFHERLAYFFQKGVSWDVVQLAHCAHSSSVYDNVLSIAHSSGNAACYLVNAHMLEPLSKTIADAAEPLERTGQHWIYQNDVAWCKYMPAGCWYLFTEKLAYQRPSYSDLSQTYVPEPR